jgi:cytochrome c biogenesis protein
MALFMRNLWHFLTSVRLAISLLAILAVTSIIGTIIPQHESAEFYVKRYSPEMAAFFQVLDIPNMYGSWWFTGLLAILALNLIACSLDRLPNVWKLITASATATPVERIKKMPERASWLGVQETAIPALASVLAARGFRNANENKTLFTAAKGAWSRLGAYIVHLSILIIFAGALIGQRYGFKGSVMLPEGNSTAVVFPNQGGAPKNLGFTVRCDFFSVAYYDNGMPKDYLSRLTIVEDGRSVLSRDVQVNQPLRYKGITFYQSSFQPYPDFIVEFTKNDGDRHNFIIPFQEQATWAEEGVNFGVLNAQAHGQRLERLKLWLKKGENAPVELQLAAGEEATYNQYKVRVRQLYATGLQVAKDPGVPLVYAGCGLLIFGLYVAFFLAHRRLFVVMETTATGRDIWLTGTANKNRFGFARDFAALKEQVEKTLAA